MVEYMKADTKGIMISLFTIGWQWLPCCRPEGTSGMLGDSNVFGFLFLFFNLRKDYSLWKFAEVYNHEMKDFSVCTWNFIKRKERNKWTEINSMFQVYYKNLSSDVYLQTGLLSNLSHTQTHISVPKFSNCISTLE